MGHTLEHHSPAWAAWAAICEGNADTTNKMDESESWNDDGGRVCIYCKFHWAENTPFFLFESIAGEAEATARH